jgi:hypothetical protein
MSLARRGGAIIPPKMPARAKDMPVPEYWNFVGKVSEVRIGARPCKRPVPKNVMRNCRSITSGIRLP